jgi:hypothetical protein
MAGVHSIKHESFMQKTALQEMVRRGPVLVLTVDVVRSVKELSGGFEWMPKDLPQAEDNLLVGHMHGLPLAHWHLAESYLQ